MADSTRRNTPVLVIGLGRFGAATASALDRLGREVLAVDTREHLVQQWADRVTHAVVADATSMEALQQIGASDFHTAVCAVGDSIESSVLVTANLVDLGIPDIWAKAISPSHGTILQRIGAHHIIFPEAEAGERAAHVLSGRMMDYLDVDSDYAIVKMTAPSSLIGRSLQDSQVRAKYRITVVGIKPVDGQFSYATAASVLNAGDVILVSGDSHDLERFTAID